MFAFLGLHKDELEVYSGRQEAAVTCSDRRKVGLTVLSLYCMLRVTIILFIPLVLIGTRTTSNPVPWLYIRVSSLLVTQ